MSTGARWITASASAVNSSNTGSRSDAHTKSTPASRAGCR
ncbi:hypothetical protein BZL30_4920 [Mycobacterium kansasii]|uniref:Uncharacterized protein n=1 Tax=Mycobacterium kansasii TaxID=1768 RepID=A0A1V3X3T2_MYCKA|nr:hypothetical protein BZL30_4920 [Mycobacterium kansasii]